MSTPTFAEKHCFIAFLEKPTETDGFEQIVDFLNANPIKFALTVIPTIYTSCIKQFWTSAKVKTINEDVRLQALIDGKKVIVNELNIRRDHRLDDVEGTACLPNAAIFEELARMGFENPSQKLTFYKAFFSPQWKFLNHTFCNILVLKLLSGMNSAALWHLIFINPSLTMKVFANMKRVGTCFSEVITPLFETMMVQAPAEVGEIPTDNQDTPILTQPPSSQPSQKHKSRRKHMKETEVSHDEPPTEEHIPTYFHDPLPSAKIKKLKKRVKNLDGKKKKKTHGLKRLYRVGLSARIVSSDKECLGDQEDASKQERSITDINQDERTTLLLELMMSKRSKKNTECVNAVNEELTVANHNLVPAKSNSYYQAFNDKSLFGEIIIPKKSQVKLKLDRSISRPIGVSEDVYVKVGKFHFSADFVVIDFDVDPRVPLILGRSFLKTGRALIDMFESELTVRVGKEAITFNLDQTSRYSANYNNMTANRIDVIDMAYKEYSQEVLGFSDEITKEVDAFLALEDDPTSPEVDQSYVDSEGDILLLEIFLNDDPSLPTPNQGNYLPQVRKELKICEAKTDKSSIEEPHEVELKELPPHLEYTFLEGDDKLPVIIAKYLSVEEKAALINVLKSHKRAITWKLSDIKGIDPEFCTHKILMDEDFEPTVQHQIRVNPKIHDVIKNEVLKLLDAGLIYPIYDSPWVSPVHCVPKKGGFTFVKNEENELIMTHLVTGWRVCIDYHKLNEATRKDHFPLPFMDQMLERLAGNEYYYFLDGFLGYFQIPIDSKDKEKTTFTCPYRMFAYRRIPFRLCNAPGTFQRCMMAILHDMIEKTMEVFMDDFSVFGNSFQTFKEGIVLGHRISKNGIEVDKAKVDVITKLPHPITVKGIRSFLGHASFYRRKIPRFLRWVLLLQGFTFKVIDIKGAENLTADHLSQLENPHKNVPDPKGINESFPLEILNLVSPCSNSSTSWFVDFANYHAGNFVVKGMSSQ
uniref:Reverse transcriptase domain-containing protein n=1 Tax=Tanacetum cinerariifolium TaxID=118510 RepID=A0A6L2J655_TANCI|nr:reverse transcriptase domain-containing protein [Tanacetum cinerariifolium]